MDAHAWILYAFIVALIVAGSLLYYRRREPRVRGRAALALLRAATLAVLVLLLFDPLLPTVVHRGPTVALLDASLSMRLPTPAGTRWSQAVAAVGAATPDRVLLFGDEVRRPPEPLDRVVPGDTATLLAPALRAAVEAGASRVIVVTDAGVEDATEARRVVADAGVVVAVQRVGQHTLGNVGLVEVQVPAWAKAGDTLTARVSVAAVGAPLPDSDTVVLLRAGRELARARVPTPVAGRTSPAALRFTVPPGRANEPVRFDVRLLEGGSMTADDERTVFIRISERPAGVVVVSLRPDEEARFLMPVLERALGVPVRGWLALEGGRYIRLGAGREAGAVDPESTVRRAVSSAEMVVLHGVGPGAPAWALDALRRARRLLVLPIAPTELLPVRLGEAVRGDWYPVDSLPPSPVAGLLAGVSVADVPPLPALRTASAPAGWWAPLLARLARQGEARPVLVAGTTRDGRRLAVALGESYWRWAFAGGSGRALYDRLWSGVGGWLMEGAGPPAVPEVRPEPRVVPRGAAVRWQVPPGLDSIRVLLSPGTDTAASAPIRADTGVVLDTLVRVTGGVAVTAALAPGTYRYRAVAPGAAPGARGAATGELVVESYSPEFTRPAVAVGALTGEPVGARGEEVGAGPARPLHASPWPYVALVLLLSVEWVLRRRWGLR